MKISKKAYYGLRAVLALAQAKKPLSIHSLATLEHLPEDYLEKILQTLRRRDIVRAQKGVTGGYTLARNPETLTAWDIVSTLDGSFTTFALPKEKSYALPAKNARGVASPGWPCPQVSHCQSNEVWRMLETQIEKTLSRVSLLHLLSQSQVKVNE